jgi:hypothetical protein
MLDVPAAWWAHRARAPARLRDTQDIQSALSLLLGKKERKKERE